jgi:methylglutaconyl-CoA hydratase
MNDASPVSLSVGDGIGTITIDSPGNRNALSRAVTEGLIARFEQANADDGVRAIVLTATGGTFCSGADLKEQREAAATGDAGEGTQRVVAVLQQILESPKPVVGRINGHARAGGIGLVAACDIAVAAEPATFAFTEVRLGLVPAMIAVVTLPKLGIVRASEYYLTGEMLGAEQAQAMGLLNAVAPVTGLDEAVAHYSRALILGAPHALAATKQLVRDLERMPKDEAFQMAERLSAEFFNSEEGREGMTAFAEKRSPRWAVV